MLRLVRFAVLIGAIGVLVVGLAGGAMAIAWARLNPGADQALVAVAGASIVSISAGFGIGLASQAWKAIRGKASEPFRPGRVWPLVLLWLLSVALGHAAISRDVLPAAALPMLHIGAAALPSFIAAAMVGRVLSGQARWRDIVLQMSSGVLLSTGLALTLELILIAILVFVMLVVLAMSPAGLAPVDTLAHSWKNAGSLGDASWLAPTARSPIVVAGTLFVVAGIVPVIEEAVKAVGVGLLAYRRPTMAEAFLWGVVGGAGFALVEGLFSSMGDMTLWSRTVLLRGGATMVHSLTGGLVGLAWYAVIFQLRWLRALALYAASVSIHGLWNALSALAALFSLATRDLKPGHLGRALSEFWSVGTVTALLGLSIGAIAGLIVLARRLRSAGSEAAPTGPEPASA